MTLLFFTHKTCPMKYTPGIKTVKLREHKITNSEEISCDILQLKVNENCFSLLKAGWSPYDDDITLYSDVMWVIVSKPSK